MVSASVISGQTAGTLPGKGMTFAIWQFLVNRLPCVKIWFWLRHGPFFPENLSDSRVLRLRFAKPVLSLVEGLRTKVGESVARHGLHNRSS